MPSALPLCLQPEALEAAQFDVEVLASRRWGWERERRMVGKIGSPAAWPVPLLPLEENVMKLGSDRMLPIPRGVCQLRARLLSQAWDAQRRTSYQLSGRAGNTRQFLCSGICSLFQGRAWLQSLSRAPSIPQNAQGSAGSARICQDLPASLACALQKVGHAS